MRLTSRLISHLTSHLTSRLLALGLIASAFLPWAAQAVALNTPVPPELVAQTTLGGTTLAARPELAGLALEDVLTPFTINIGRTGETITGTVRSRVVRERSTGTLDFYWQVNVASAAADLQVLALRLNNFGYGNLQDADWRADGVGTVAPGLAFVFNTALNPGGGLNFSMRGGVAAGEQSRLMFLHTDATAYARTAEFDVLSTGPGYHSQVYSTFAPVPEPSVVLMTIAGVSALGLTLRRQRGQGARRQA